MLFNGMTTGLFLVAAISLLPAGWMTLEWVRRLAVIVGLLPALGSAVYKGVLLSTSSQPGWKEARWLGGYLTSSALMLGCAEMLVLSVLMGHARAAAIFRPALGLLLVLNLIPLCLCWLISAGRCCESIPTANSMAPAPSHLVGRC